MITKEIFKEQLEINPDTDKFFVLVKTDEYVENKGIYPVVKFNK